MRLKFLNQLRVGDVVKCLSECLSEFEVEKTFIGLVTKIDSDGFVHVLYDDGDLCRYDDDEDVYNENLYRVTK